MAFIYEDDIDSNKTKSPKNKFIYEDDAGMEDSVLNKSYGDFNWFSSDDWGDAVEGLGIATGITGDIDKEIQDTEIPFVPKALEPTARRGAQIATNIGSGLKNAARGAAAGVAEFAGDATNLVTPDFLGGNTAEAWFDEGADYWREDIPEDSVGGAMGEELGYGAGMGPAVGKAVKYGGKGAGYLTGAVVGQANKMLHNKGIKYGDKIKKEAQDAYNYVYNKKRNAPLDDADIHFNNLAQHGEIPKENLINYVARGKNKTNAVMAAEKAGALAKQEAMGDIPMLGVATNIARAADAIGPGKRRFATLENIIQDSSSPVWGPNALRRTNRAAIRNGIMEGADDTAEAAAMFKKKLKTMTGDTAKKYGNALDNVLSRINNKKTITAGVAVNAFDSAMEKALNNTERLNLPEGTIDNQDGTYTLPDHNGTIVRRKR